MKIAIIGTGISGLTAAYLLNRENEITVFEKNDYIGGHTHTHLIKSNNNKIAVDSGFIVYNENTYPNFIKLLDQLKIRRQKTSMGFSVKSLKKNMEYAGNSINSIFAKRGNIFSFSFLMMLFEIIKFNRNAKRDLQYIQPDETLGFYLEKYKYSDFFIENYIIPMGAAIWSTKANSMLKMPALFFIRFFYNHGLLQLTNRSNWWVIKGGSYKYVNKIVENFKDKIRINTSVNSIKRINGKIIINYGLKNTDEVYDAVVIATHSDQALEMLTDPSKEEIDILSMLMYQKNKALLHTDDTVLPNKKLAWASWNYNLDSADTDPVTLTYNMNILQSLNEPETYCVSLNNSDLVEKNKIIKKLSYEHPLFTVESIMAQKRKNEISGINNTFYCGAYWHNGFHEDGVVSALEVCKHFGLTL